MGRARSSPHARVKEIFSLLAFCKMHECFHSSIERKLSVKPACLKELLRTFDYGNREFAVVLVLKFLLAAARFVDRGRTGFRFLGFALLPEKSIG
jgi:hypothetical protein